MFDTAAEYYTDLSWKARKLARELQQVDNKFEHTMAEIEKTTLVAKNMPQYKYVDKRKVEREVIKENEMLFLNVFRENLQKAMLNTEYKRKSKFFDNILKVIHENISEILEEIVINGIEGAKELMANVAGDWGDFIEGVESARTEMGLYMQQPLKQRARVWKYVIWPDDILYDATIDERFKMWGNKVPYWVIVEEGNFYAAYAFPKFEATNFFHNSARVIQNQIETETIYRMHEYGAGTTEYEQVLVKEKRIFTEKLLVILMEAIQKFEENKDLYQPGDILNKFKNLENDFMYKIHVTPTGLLGIRKIR